MENCCCCIPEDFKVRTKGAFESMTEMVKFLVREALNIVLCKMGFLLKTL